jgi:hypothetical protein
MPTYATRHINRLHLGGKPHLWGSPTLHPHLHLQGIRTPTATLTSVPTRYIHTYSTSTRFIYNSGVQLHLLRTATPVGYSYTCGVQPHPWGTASPAIYCYIHDEILHLRGLLAPGHSYPFNSHLHSALARRTCTWEARLQWRGTGTVQLHSNSAHARTSARVLCTCTLQGTPAPAWYKCNCVVQPHLLGTCICKVHLHLRGTPGPARYTCAC